MIGSLAEFSREVLLSLWVRGLVEEGAGVSVFDEFPKIKEGGFLGDAHGLLHVVSDDDDGEFFP